MMRDNRKITARTKRIKGSFELEEIWSKGTMSGKEISNGGSKQKNNQRNLRNQIIGISRLIQLVPLILSPFNKMSTKNSFDV